jgi:hypothetical protein
MVIILCLLWLALAAFDSYATIRILSKHGVDKELNYLIGQMCGWWGIKQGVILGIFLPATAITALAWIFQSVSVTAVIVSMAVLVGMRAMLTLLQLRTLRNA